MEKSNKKSLQSSLVNVDNFINFVCTYIKIYTRPKQRTCRLYNTDKLEDGNRMDPNCSLANQRDAVGDGSLIQGVTD